VHVSIVVSSTGKHPEFQRPQFVSVSETIIFALQQLLIMILHRVPPATHHSSIVAARAIIGIEAVGSGLWVSATRVCFLFGFGGPMVCRLFGGCHFNALDLQSLAA
jgi:hypothetical protein